MRTLNATLQANQDGNRRSPLVEILSVDPAGSIPMDGATLTTETINEFSPAVLVHSLGRLAGCYIFGPGEGSVYTLKYFFTDTGKTTFSIIDLELTGSPYVTVIKSVSICEMANGNVGIVWLEDDQSNHFYRIKYQIVTVTGTKVANGEIDHWSHDYYSNGISVIYNPLANEYLLVTAGEYETPTEYVVYTIASDDFQTWGDWGIVTDAAALKLSAPSLMYDPGHSIFWLWVTVVDSVGGSGEERTNIYYATSPDGTTWTLGGALTGYDDYATIGNNCRSVMKSASEIYAIWNQEQKSLMVNKDSAGWLTPTSYDSYNGNICGIHFDPTDRKLYIVTTNWPGIAVERVDVDSWEIDKAWSSWNGDFHQIFNNNPGFGYDLGSRNESRYVAVHTLGALQTAYVEVLDANDNLVIRNYAFGSWPAYGITANVNFTNTYFWVHLRATQIDLTNDRIWFFSYWQGTFAVGYIPFSSGSYTYTELFSCLDAVPESDPVNNVDEVCYFKVYPEYDYILIYGSRWNGTNSGFCCIYKISTGELIKHYYLSAFSTFPEKGLICAEIVNGKIYAGFYYSNLYSQGDHRGLLIIDLATDAISFQRPTFATVDDYGFTNIKAMEDGRLLITSSIYALIIFDPTTLTWTNFSNANCPGLTTPADDSFYLLDYDEANELIFTAFGGIADPHGVIAISVYGAFKQAYYKIGTYSGGTWSWGEADNMVMGNNIYDLAAAMDAESGNLYAFGVFKEEAEMSVWWDLAGPSFDFAPFWIRDTDLALTWTIDGDPGKLEITLSHGHLFDPFNTASLFRKYVQKGRKVTVRLGELIGGVEYWENQGTYWITERRMEGYERGKLPTIRITAEDMRTLWKFKEIIASDEYSDDPTDIIEDLVMEADDTIDSGDFSWPAIDNETILYHQWVETTLLDAIQQILDRYGYFLKINRDDKISAGKIALNNAVTHAYGNSAQVLSFMPDDTFSDFTNQVTVVGQERTYTEVVYAEERITTRSGTTGWYGYKNDFIVYYSDDQSARYRSPRLVVIETATTIAFKLSGGVSEGITYIDANEKYCIVTVSAPNLVPALIVAIAVYLVAAFIPDIVVTVGFIVEGGFTIPIGRIIQAIAMIVIVNIISSIGNYQYEIYGLPVGYVRRSLQATADDTELQGEIGKVISTKLENEFCYTTEDCQLVANHERDVLKGQRRRVKFSKISHLQDEEGDTISVIHPYSGQVMKVFITDLKRTYRVPSGAREEASCIDEIEGWYLS
ncbi:MAG: hypothetical protein HPY65_13855 [Syntrophaceae bacterium]|nr:hypothetical protein [Syntrophaceae bacterium]